MYTVSANSVTELKNMRIMFNYGLELNEGQFNLYVIINVLLVQIKVLCDALSKRVKALKRYESKLIYKVNGP